MRKSHLIAATLFGATLLLSLSACSKKSGEMTFAHERFGVKLPKGVELSCKKLYNAGGCENYATGPMNTMDPDLVDAQICDGGTASTAFYVVATKRPTQAFVPYPGRNPTPLTPSDMMLLWGKCKDARIGDARSMQVEGSTATDFNLTTPMGAAKARVFVSDEYSILAMAEPKSSGEKPEEIADFASSLHPGPGPNSK
jgi:hypothetical protein